MMMEITKVEQGVVYEMNPDAGYPEGTTAEALSITEESITLEITEYTGRGPDEMQYYSSVKIANEDGEIEAMLNVEIVEPEEPEED
jgi:hypothetical protein